MVEQEKLQLQGLKTIREMQESMQKEDMQDDNKASNTLIKESERDSLRAYVEETQKILDGNIDMNNAADKKDMAQNTQNLSHAKTIKESMKDWIDEDKTNTTKNTLKQPQTIQNATQTMQQSPQNTPKEAVSTTRNNQIQTPSPQATKTQVSNVPDEIESKQEKYQQIVKANANTKQETWLLLDEFLKLSGLEKEKVAELIKDKTIKSKQENGRIYVEASTGTSALIKKVENRLVSLDMNGNALDPVFVEKTIATILGLHEKVLSSKDETIAAFKSENSFLKEALVSMQEIYDDDKKTIEILRQQLQKTQEEVEFVKRKYKLMWGKVSNSTT